MQSDYQGSRRRWRVDIIIIAVTVGVFLLQSILTTWVHSPASRELPFLEKFFALYPDAVRQGFVWSFFTYGFLHSTDWILHILFNMLVFFFFARPIIARTGEKLFLVLYFGAILAGGIAWLLFNLSSTMPLVGASAGVIALVICFVCLNPSQSLFLFPFPFPIKAAILGYIVIGLNVFGFLFSELPGSGNVAYSAHLGGALFGWLFYRTIFSQKSLLPKSRPRMEKPDWLKKKPFSSSASTKFEINLQSKASRAKELDRILDKINEKGFASLTEEEKKTLDKARDLR